MSTNALAPSAVTHRDPKGRKFMSIVEAAYDKAGLSDDEGQYVNEAAGLAELVANFIENNRYTNKYANEECQSNYGYRSGYRKPTSLTEQANKFREFFPGIGYTNPDHQKAVEEGKIALPDNVEGWFAIPNWMKNPEIFGPTYAAAVQKILDTLSQQVGGRFFNWRDGQINDNRLRQSTRTKKYLAKLAEEQGNPDILIVPAQFGIRHRGRSTRRVIEVLASNEFGLGSFAIGCMLLTHQNRLAHYDDLWIDCLGDEFDVPDSGDRFDLAPYFYFSDDKLKFGTKFVDVAPGHYGSVSGFSPQ